ncbi:DNA cytosine methyltransferase [Chloroflexus sp.]|uniref:DNA cytosine methyltransferase n=1 Tax=Chloroflexus sp. TaxID=1904827 RepID=UPI00298F1D4E|nr:DNA cytosine methyltransferase [Chloroflexus sp.]MDW8405514.1 DNA cytosine methyltransferase [Chloroflexus sp.]
MMSNPKALSLFSGAGGLDVGVIQAGFEVLACIEMDPFACETLRANIEREHRSTKVYEQDIRQVNPIQLLLDLNLQPGELDLLFGGPPCQPFSQIGKRSSLRDERGLLLFEMVRFARSFRPRVILIEQVKGLLNAPDHNGVAGNVFKKLIDELEAIGYHSKWKVINAADYGVPQLRQRVFIVSAREEIDFHFPEPTHSATCNSSLFFSLPPYVTVGEALQGLAEPCQSDGGHSPIDNHVDITPAGDRRRISGVPEGSHLAAQTHLPAEQRRNLTKKDTTKFKRLSRHEPANTLRCGEIFFHPTEDRYLTPREYMRLHGYPDNYILKGPIRGRSGRVRYLDQHRQIANSVPPPVAKIIAQAILEALYAPDI